MVCVCVLVIGKSCDWSASYVFVVYIKNEMERKKKTRSFTIGSPFKSALRKKCGECTYVNIGRLDLDNYRHERQVVPNDNHTCMMQIRTKNLISIYRCNLHIFKVMFTLCVFSIAMDQPLAHSLAPHSLAMYIIHKLE